MSRFGNLSPGAVPFHGWGQGSGIGASGYLEGGGGGMAIFGYLGRNGGVPLQASA